jgi:hypothetical protein
MWADYRGAFDAGIAVAAQPNDSGRGRYRPKVLVIEVHNILASLKVTWRGIQ